MTPSPLTLAEEYAALARECGATIVHDDFHEDDTWHFTPDQLAAFVERVSAPDGWKLVPIKPTPEMLEKGQHEMYVTSGGDFDACREEIAHVYEALIKAAPAANQEKNP